MSQKFFSLLRNWICLLQNYFSSYAYLKDICITLKRIQFASELTILQNLQISKFQRSLHKKQIEIIKASVLLLMLQS